MWRIRPAAKKYHLCLTSLVQFVESVWSSAHVMVILSTIFYTGQPTVKIHRGRKIMEKVITFLTGWTQLLSTLRTAGVGGTRKPFLSHLHHKFHFPLSFWTITAFPCTASNKESTSCRCRNVVGWKKQQLSFHCTLHLQHTTEKLGYARLLVQFQFSTLSNLVSQHRIK